MDEGGAVTEPRPLRHVGPRDYLIASVLVTPACLIVTSMFC